ncbi:MAG: rod shape-determining protein MreC [Bacteroidales bacterium]|jgi:rod shape-determining protein MreC|nr:rod shape-determining protein MreC [Bacteroidales bacterium]
MRNLLRFIIRYHFFFLFLLLETVSVILIVQYNNYQRAQSFNFSKSIQGSYYETFGGIREYLSLRQTNRDLYRENTLLRNQMDRLARNLETTSNGGYDSIPHRQYSYIPARVINNTVNKQFNFITLNKGRHHGIEPEMAVIAPNGVVGVVYAASGNYSTVIPMINRSFGLSAKILKNGYFGSLSWAGSGYQEAILEEIPFHVEIQPGDTIVTSGYSAIFPEGITVGIIAEFEARANFYTISVDIAVDYKNLQYVNVIRNLLQDERRELERISGND